MNGSLYVSARETSLAKRPNIFFAIVSLLLSLVVLVSAVGTGLFVKQQTAQAGPLEWVVCEWAGEDSIAYFAYRAAFTDDIAYLFNSKSAINSGTDDVAGGLNLLLGLTHDFTATNEEIMGVSLSPIGSYTGTVNGGEKVNPYDRFGVAGLYWSSYGGEWNYLKVDICSETATPVNMRIGAFYEDRLAPLSTWGAVGQSTDVRSLAAAHKELVVAANWINVLANGIFNITKLVVVTTNALIGLAFSDILSAVGLNNLIGGDNGIFDKLYSGVYLPLILIIMLIMASWAAWNGIAKRAYRRTLGGIAQSVFMFVMAAIVAFNPAFFMALPNNIAIIAQSLVVNALSAGIYAGDGLCSVGGVYTVNSEGEQVLVSPDSDGTVQVPLGDGSTSATDVDENLNLLQQATQSMQSVIGCQLWYTYVFKPWVSGQYGTDFNNLWANGYADTANFADAQELGNNNSAWVGDAAVPLGGGYTIHNWALFQVSTQTNAHVPLGQEEPELSVYTDGVANDWWRIVDAVSNYNETSQLNGIPSENTCDYTNNPIDGAGACNAYQAGATDPVESVIPDTSIPPTPYWQSWIGADPWNRLMVALGSVLPAMLGNLAPLLFAGMSVVFALAVAVSMAFAPIFLLLGSWPGRGWELFKGWGQLVLNLTMKRILAGLLLVFSLIFIGMILALVKDNWFVSLIALIIVSVALVKFRSQIFDRVSGLFSFNFSSSGMRDTTVPGLSAMRRRSGQILGMAGRFGTSAAVGASVAKEAGRPASAGFWEGLKREGRNQIYRNDTLARAWNDAEAALPNDHEGKNRDQFVSSTETCAFCHKPLIGNQQGVRVFNGGILPNGNFVCDRCMNNENVWRPAEEGARRVTRRFLTDEDEQQIRGLDSKDAKAVREARASQATASSAMESKDFDELKARFKDPKTGAVADDLTQLMAKMFKKDLLMRDVRETIPQIPEQLKPHMTPESRELMPYLWKDNSQLARETISIAYAHAFVHYSYEVGEISVGDLSGDIRKGVEGDIAAVLGNIANELNKS